MSSTSTDPADAPSILIVEDDASIGRLLHYLFSGEGHSVRLCPTIAEARSALARRNTDLVVLDRQLPDGDGLDLARELKQQEEWDQPYILMLSAFASDQQKIAGLDSGADDYVTKPFVVEELLARVKAGLRIVRLQKALLRANRELEILSTTDGLTGVHNRRWFDGELERLFAHASRYQRPLSLALLDIDFFKAINDTHGHLSGDAVLTQLAQRLEGLLRRTDSVARIGGEEFAILLPEIALFEGVQVAEKVRAAIAAEKFDVGPELVDVTVSVGLASVPHTAVVRPSHLVWCADQALYRAKHLGRNRIEIERRGDPWRKPKRVGPPAIPGSASSSSS